MRADDNGDEFHFLHDNISYYDLVATKRHIRFLACNPQSRKFTPLVTTKRQQDFLLASGVVKGAVSRCFTEHVDEEDGDVEWLDARKTLNDVGCLNVDHDHDVGATKVGCAA